MPRSRSALLLAAPAAATVALAASAWATDADWARDAGLDVWNLGRLEDQLRACRAEGDRLDQKLEESAARAAANWELFRAVAAGRRSLAGAAADSLRLNAGSPGFEDTLDFLYPGLAREAQAARNLIRMISLWPELAEPERGRALARLRAEYAADFPAAGGSAP
jgi:hypothetical protein